MKPLLTLLLLTELFFVSCRTSNILAGELKSEQNATSDSVFYSSIPHPYHIRKDDKITISVWGQDNLSVGSTYGIYNSNEVYGKWLMVDASGNIEIPKIGRFRVENMTIIQLKDSLRILFGEWVKTPIVDIKVLNRSIIVLGEVHDPQTIGVDKERTSLLEALAICKGVDFYANLKSIKVFRQVGENVHVASIDLSKSGDYRLKNITLYPGDVVIVPSKRYKAFDKRISTIIPFTTTLSAAAILLGLF
ncbi:MAG: polysaccharide biosynthesis/export family protein [Sediminibacterium sp.]|nr:polysaccharide biosynthesis/export family protein [Sediminibacterium sp.]